MLLPLLMTASSGLMLHSLNTKLSQCYNSMSNKERRIRDLYKDLVLNPNTIHRICGKNAKFIRECSINPKHITGKN